MVFASPIFLFLFLPVVLAGYFVLLAPKLAGATGRLERLSIGASNLWLLLASLLFYFWGEQWLFGVMAATIVLDYSVGYALGRTERPAARKALITFSIAGNLLLLGYYKYFGFGVDSLNAFLGEAGLHGLRFEPLLEITLPLGISFYTFQSMSYTIDVYRREVPATKSFLDFSTFVTMFPQLVAGPIVRYRDVAAELVERTVTFDRFSHGVARFIMGLGKKVLVANTVAVPADRIFALPAAQLTPSLAWLGVACYTLQIYFDFSGYSDMAIGMGHMLGFSFPENFRYPYAARSMQEFWRRWHMTLSTWFRDYLYVPLGGGRVSPGRVYLNLVIVFFLCGLWHGARWTFVVWGLFHGVFLVIERLGFGARLERWPAVIRHAYVIAAAMAGWVFFRSDSFAQAMAFFGAMGGNAGAAGTLAPRFADVLTPDVSLALVAGWILAMPFLPAVRNARETFAVRAQTLAPLGRLAWAGLKVILLGATALLSFVSISGGTYNPFIYFRF